MRRLGATIFFMVWILGTRSTGQISPLVVQLRWTGCYQLRGDLPAELKKSGWPIPQRFQLRWKKLGTDPYPFEVKALDRRGGFWWLSGWTTKSDNKVEIVWSTGFVGYDVMLEGGGTFLTGTAQPFTDTDSLERAPASFQIEARRIPCAPEDWK